MTSGLPQRTLFALLLPLAFFFPACVLEGADSRRSSPLVRPPKVLACGLLRLPCSTMPTPRVNWSVCTENEDVHNQCSGNECPLEGCDPQTMSSLAMCVGVLGHLQKSPDYFC